MPGFSGFPRLVFAPKRVPAGKAAPNRGVFPGRPPKSGPERLLPETFPWIPKSASNAPPKRCFLKNTLKTSCLRLFIAIGEFVADCGFQYWCTICFCKLWDTMTGKFTTINDKYRACHHNCQ